MMNQQGGRGRATVESSLHGFANVLALFAALLACMPIYENSQWAYELFLQTWRDHSLASLGVFAYTGLGTAAVYYICRAMFVMAAMFIAARIYMLAV